MGESVACPHCGELLADSVLSLVPSHCPQCGQNPFDEVAPQNRRTKISLSQRGERFATDWAKGYLSKLEAVIVVTVLLMPFWGALLAYNQWFVVLTRVESQGPHTITCEQLINEGVGDGDFVRLTNFRVQEDRVASTSVLGTKDVWRYAYVGVVPANASSTDLAVSILLQTEGELTVDELHELAQAEALEGQVFRAETNKLMSSARRIETAFPGIELSRCLVILPDERPASALQAYVLLIIGLLVALIGLGFWLFLIWRWLSTDEAAS